MNHNPIESISKLLEIMRRLRSPHGGCPWDRAQSFSTIAPYTIEEAYEVADAIERNALEELRAELGDLLFQVVFHAQLAAEAGLFDFADVAEAISEKLERRHPHVFAGHGEPEDPGADWETAKRSERSEAGHAGVLADVPIGLPALSRAVKLGRRAAGVGFDWPDAGGARAKVDEELAELDEACQGGHAAEIEAEMGDVLFALCNLCRHLRIDPERALRMSGRRFEQRFAGVEARVNSSGADWHEHGLETLEAWWQQAKSEASKEQS